MFNHSIVLNRQQIKGGESLWTLLQHSLRSQLPRSPERSGPVPSFMCTPAPHECLPHEISLQIRPHTTHSHTYIQHTLIHNTDPHTYAYTQTHMYSYFHTHICTCNIHTCTFIKANTYQKLYPIYTLLFRNPCLWGPRDTWWCGLREATVGSCFNPCSSWSPHL